MWSKVAARDHTVLQVFPSTNDPKEFMLAGVVSYELKDGAKQRVEWAGHGRVARSAESGQWQFAYYQVYLAGGYAENRTTLRTGRVKY